MPVDFFQEKKKQRYLILIFTLVVCVTVLIIWLGFFRNSKQIEPVFPPVIIQPKINVNWDILKDTKVNELEKFQQIPVFEGEAGRSNPFMPY